MARFISSINLYYLTAGTSGLGLSEQTTDAGVSLGGTQIGTPHHMLVPGAEESPPYNPARSQDYWPRPQRLYADGENRMNTSWTNPTSSIVGWPSALAGAPDMNKTWMITDGARLAKIEAMPLSGSNRGLIRRIVGYESAGGDFLFNEGIPGPYANSGLGAPTDFEITSRWFHPHWVGAGPHYPHASWPPCQTGLFEITPQQCEDGVTLYRCLRWQNQSGGSGANNLRNMDNYRIYIEPVDLGPCTVEVSADVRTSGLPETISDGETAPTLVSGFNGSQGHFSAPTTYADSDQPNITYDAGGDNTWNEHIWIKLTVPPKTLAKDSCFCAIWMEGQNGSGDDVLQVTGFAWELPGYLTSPIYTLRKDRPISVGGGAKFKFKMTDGNGVPVEDVPLLWTKEDLRSPTSSDTGVLVFDDDATTDENGENIAVYHAPTDGAADDQPGPHVSVSVKV